MGLITNLMQKYKQNHEPKVGYFQLVLDKIRFQCLIVFFFFTGINTSFTLYSDILNKVRYYFVKVKFFINKSFHLKMNINNKKINIYNKDTLYLPLF